MFFYAINQSIFILLMTWYVYILHCADDTLYTGITKDIERRVREHNTDDRKGAHYTRTRRPVRLVYQEACNGRDKASRREYYLKQLSRWQKLQLIS